MFHQLTNILPSRALTAAWLLSFMAAPQLQAEVINVRILGPSTSYAAHDVSAIATQLNNILGSASGYTGSTSSATLLSGATLTEAYYHPTYRATTRAALAESYTHLVILPETKFLYSYPEMAFDGVLQMSRKALAKGSTPLLLMPGTGNTSYVSILGTNSYRIANGCGIHTIPGGYAAQSASLLVPSANQAYLLAATLFTKITGLNASTGSTYVPAIGGYSTLAGTAVTTINTHLTTSHYSTSRHNSGLVRYRTITPANSTVRYAWTGSSTETGINGALTPILQASGYTTTSYKVSGTTGWSSGTTTAAATNFATNSNQYLLAYARDPDISSQGQTLIDSNQANLLPIAYEQHFISPFNLNRVLESIFVRPDYASWQALSYGWATLPVHLSVARLNDVNPAIVVNADTLHWSTPVYNMIAAMMATSALGSEPTPTATILANPQSLTGFNEGIKTVKELAFLSETQAYVPDTTLSISTQPLPDAVKGLSFNHTLSATLGTPPYTWSEVSTIGLPAGLTLSTSGQISGTVTADAGSWKLVLQVKDSTGAIRKMPQTLTVAPIPESANAFLSNLVPNIGTLAPAFSSGTFDYTASVLPSTGTITVTPTAVVGTATITVNGSPVTSGSPSSLINLIIGNTVITTVVVSEDMTATQTYTLTVTRPASSDVKTIYGFQSTITSDANGLLDLLAELNYNNGQAHAPIAVVMPGYQPATTNLSENEILANAQRLRDNGFFVISMAMRERYGSDGVRDSGGLEIHDIYDAVEAVKADPAFAALINPDNVHITGYSGGGGNVMSALTKFPDYFRLGAGYFGMSDYGYDLTHGWYNNGAGTRTSRLDIDVGNPNTGGSAVRDRYLARASNRASKNNPYSEIHLFLNSDETICPPINSTSYRYNAIAAQSFAGEFNNITVHFGGPGIYEDFNNNSINDANEFQSWPHGYPTTHQQDAAELWYRGRLLDGSIPQPVLNDADELFVAGYVITSKFKCWLGDGQNAAGNLTYALSDTLMSFALTLQTSDLTKTANLSINTARMAGREVVVKLNGVPVSSFTGGGTFNYPALGHNITLELADNGPATNTPPTFSAFAAVVAATPTNTEVEITFAALAAQGNEADSDGTVIAFVVQSVTSGTLKIGTDAVSATPFATGTNNVINATTNIYWTPTPGAAGAALNAFTVIARDNDLALSSPAVQATVQVVAPGIYSETFSAGATALSVGSFGWTAYSNGGVNYSASILNPMLIAANSSAVLIGGGGTFINGQFALISDAPAIDPTAYQNNLAISFDQQAVIAPTTTNMKWRVLVRVGSAIYASNLFAATTTVTTLSVTVADPVWSLWTGESDLTNGFDITGISGTPGYLPTGSISNIGLLAIDGPHTDDRFRLYSISITGSPTNTFATWIAGFELGGLTALTDDPDGDGIPNAIENFFGTFPNEFSQGLVAETVNGSQFTFTHPINANAASNLTATYRWSTDLTNFYNDGSPNGAGTTTVNFVSGAPSSGMVTVTATITGTVIPERLFINIAVTPK